MFGRFVEFIILSVKKYFFKESFIFFQKVLFFKKVLFLLNIITNILTRHWKNNEKSKNDFANNVLSPYLACVVTEKITQQALLALIEKWKKNLDGKDYVNH